MAKLKSKIKIQRDVKTPLTGLSIAFLFVVSFVFLCMILIVILRFFAGGILG